MFASTKVPAKDLSLKHTFYSTVATRSKWMSCNKITNPCDIVAKCCVYQPKKHRPPFSLDIFRACFINTVE